MSDPDVDLRPGRAGYWVGGLLLGAGIALGAVLFGFALAHSIGEFRELGDDIDAMQRFAVPGEDVVTLDEPGEYVLYAEGPVTPVGRVGASAVTVESTAGDSTPLVLRSVGIDETYDIGDHAGRSALRFTVDEPGDYRVTVGPVPASVTEVAVGPRVDIFGPVGSVFVVIFVPAGVGGLFVIAGAAVLIVTGVRRSGARRRARIAATPPVPAWGTMPSGYPPPGAPPGYGAPGQPLPPGLPPSAYPPPGWVPVGGPPPGPQPGPPPAAWPPAGSGPAGSGPASSGTTAWSAGGPVPAGGGTSRSGAGAGHSATGEAIAAEQEDPGAASEPIADERPAAESPADRSPENG